MMVYNTQDYRVFGLSPSSGILKTKKIYHFSKWMFPLSGEGWKIWTQQSRCLHPSPEDGNRTIFRNVLFFLASNIPNDG
jgi:hypothetical protein